MVSMYLLGVVLCLAVGAHSAAIKQEPREEAATRKCISISSTNNAFPSDCVNVDFRRLFMIIDCYI